MYYEIKVGTVTRARRSVYILDRYNIKSSISRISNPNKSEGCGYTVRVDGKSLNNALSALKENNIEYFGVDKI
ncbi:MAG: DUF3343 domain-containing protein [Eubacterium sp.]|nr:DUF3343 domain-containing protein [Eubacterium sp.]